MVSNKNRNGDLAFNRRMDLVHQMAHELKGPLHSILGFTELLIRDASISRTSKTYLTHILDAVDHMAKVIDDAHAAGDKLGDKMKNNEVSINLLEIAEECVAMMKPLANSKGLRFQISINSSATVLADRSILKQVLLNLISNAIKYNKTEGAVILNTKPLENKKWRLSIKDTGVGISKENLNKLFNPFMQSISIENSNDGDGLGLFITKNLIESLDGSIGVSSEEGCGSEFWIELKKSQLN